MNTFFIILGLIVVAVAGFFIGRWQGMSSHTKKLADDLEQKEQELSELKSQMNDHFDETARLFGNLTEEYKTFYQHLAKSADKMGNKNFQLALASNTTLKSLQIHENPVLTEDPASTISIDKQDIEVKPPLDYVQEDRGIEDHVKEARTKESHADNSETDTSEPVEKTAQESTDDAHSLNDNKENKN